MSDSRLLKALTPVWRESVASLGHNLKPGVVLWLLAAAVVAAYYLLPGARPLFETVSSWKAQGGFVYSLAATALFAGLIPFLYFWAVPATRPTARLSLLLFLVGFWAYRGVEVDLFYRFQGWLFGNEVTLATVAAKVAFDQFVYNLIWACASQNLAYHWKNHHFSLSAFRGFHWREFFTRRLPVTVVSSWVVWIPVVSLVYSLPADLQIPLFNLAACFWSLVVATLADRSKKR